MLGVKTIISLQTFLFAASSTSVRLILFVYIFFLGLVVGGSGGALTVLSDTISKLYWMMQIRPLCGGTLSDM